MRALVIEDSLEIAEVIQASLRHMDIASDCFDKGQLGLEAMRGVEYDMLVLDLNLPDADGLEILRRIRAGGNEIPILIVSARVDVDDRVKGLDLGADDYLIKPFDLEELEARVRALLRRKQESRTPAIEVGQLRFDQTTREFFIGEESLSLSPRERSVLEILVRNKGQVFSKERIAQHIFSFDDDARESSIEIYVHRLRKKLEPSGVSIVTKRGLGYVLEVE